VAVGEDTKAAAEAEAEVDDVALLEPPAVMSHSPFGPRSHVWGRLDGVCGIEVVADMSMAHTHGQAGNTNEGATDGSGAAGIEISVCAGILSRGGWEDSSTESTKCRAMTATCISEAATKGL